MSARGKAAKPPLSEAEARHRLALEQGKAQRRAQLGFFSEPDAPAFPPPPELEEPPADEPLGEEAQEAHEAFIQHPEAVSPEQAAEPIGGADEAAEHVRPAAEKVAEQIREELAPDHRVEFDTEPLGPDSFGGSDEESHLMAQTSAERLLRETTAFGEEHAGPTPAARGEALGTEASEALSPASGAAHMEESGASSQPAGFALFGHNLFGDEVKAKASGPLAERFKLPPFTVFDARQGAWQDRKRAWLALGIQSEVGRGENLLNMSDTVLEPDPVKRAEMVKQREKKRKHAFDQEFVLGAQPGRAGEGNEGKSWARSDTGLSRKLAPGGGGGGAWLGGPKTSSSEKFGRDGESDVICDENGNPLASKTGTSIFDPVLTELVYSWFAPPAGMILDPFAGGSVRGIVASKLGRMYVGIELRAEQIAANEKQAAKICQGDDFQPVWIEGDSQNAKALTEGGAFDFIMACPPYFDLEQYSEDPRDLSNMNYAEFAQAYENIIASALELLKPDRFACFVVGDVRDEDGLYRGFPELTVRCFEQHGGRKYNEAVLVTSVGSLPIRISKQFGRGRKLGKTHQNVLVFVKGDPKRAAEACGGQQEFKL